LLAGDIFDHNRVPGAMVDGVSSLLAEAGLPVVILPGNHDCLTAGSVYERGGIADVPNVRISGTDGEQAFRFPELDLEVWGRAHAEYRNMAPLRDPPPRSALRRIVMAHGHWLRDEGDRHRGWLLTSEEIAAADADYVALGHWPQAQRAGNDSVPAYYCGSPDLAGTVNVVRFVEDAAAADVRRAPLMRKVPP
jgi:DNA repair exonuclease SbcCD nuclease subunit